MSKSIKFWSTCILLIFCFVGCNKESLQELNRENEKCEPDKNKESARVVSRPFKMNSTTWYRISPTTPAPLTGLPGQLSFANVPGGGSGNATHMGQITVWFNQLAYSPDGLNPPAGTVSAPVSEVVNYPVLFPGAPLPLIQPNDFTGLVQANAWLQLPATVNGQIVNAVLYDVHGDAVFLAATTSSVTTFVSPQRINFSGDGMFAGGRGRFANATGAYHFSGFFNPQNPNDAGYEIEGTIIY